MISKSAEKEKAIELRKSGKTYSEILKIVPVSKSSLSLWLQNVGLAKKQKHRLTEKKRLAGLRGGAARKRQRIEVSSDIISKAEKEIGAISDREFWLLGIMLYWGEGSKEKEYRPGSGVEFTNSDPFMLRYFITWLYKIFKLREGDIEVEIYIHEIYYHRIKLIKQYWSKVTGLSLGKFDKVYFKRHTIKTIRKNVGNMYNGNLRIRVKASSTMLRKITGWTKGIYENKGCGIV